MKNRILLLFMFVCIVSVLEAQGRHRTKHVLRPGISFSFLPSWLLDDIEGNTPAKMFLGGLYGHKEIWKESFFTMGIVYGKINGKEADERKGIIVPLKLQKFFTPERKGFNLSIGLLMNYCKSCGEGIGGGLSNEISYLFSADPFRVNAGLQIIEGGLFDEFAIHVGGQVQLIYHPIVAKGSKK